jgi:putative transposase
MRRRYCIDKVRDKLGVSERPAARQAIATQSLGGGCRVLKQHRTTQRHIPRGREDEERLVGDMIELARQYGRYGYRRGAAHPRSTGWHVNDKRIERLWKPEGLKVPSKQPKK